MLDEVPRAIEVDGVVVDVAAVRMAHSTLERDICFKIVNLPFLQLTQPQAHPASSSFLFLGCWFYLPFHASDYNLACVLPKSSMVCCSTTLLKETCTILTSSACGQIIY